VRFLNLGVAVLLDSVLSKCRRSWADALGALIAEEER
jgi:hypothetical protein